MSTDRKHRYGARHPGEYVEPQPKMDRFEEAAREFNMSAHCGCGKTYLCYAHERLAAFGRAQWNAGIEAATRLSVVEGSIAELRIRALKVKE